MQLKCIYTEIVAYIYIYNYRYDEEMHIRNRNLSTHLFLASHYPQIFEIYMFIQIANPPQITLNESCPLPGLSTCLPTMGGLRMLLPKAGQSLGAPFLQEWKKNNYIYNNGLHQSMEDRLQYMHG